MGLTDLRRRRARDESPRDGDRPQPLLRPDVLGHAGRDGGPRGPLALRLPRAERPPAQRDRRHAARAGGERRRDRHQRLSGIHECDVGGGVGRRGGGGLSGDRGAAPRPGPPRPALRAARSRLINDRMAPRARVTLDGLLDDIMHARRGRGRRARGAGLGFRRRVGTASGPRDSLGLAGRRRRTSRTRDGRGRHPRRDARQRPARD